MQIGRPTHDGLLDEQGSYVAVLQPLEMRISQSVFSPFSQTQGLLLLCHGICEHSGRYVPLADILTSNGFEVFAMDHRGHGRSDGYRNYINSMSDVIQDNCDFLESIHSLSPSLPVFVMVIVQLNSHA